MHGARNIGGGEYSISYLILGLNRDVFTPLVLYTRENPIVERLRKNGVKVVQIPLDERIISVYRDEITKNPFKLFSYGFFFILAVKTVMKALKEYDVDLIHPHDNLSKIIGGIAAKLVRIPVVAHCRDLLRNNFVERGLMFFQLAMMSKIIAVSEKNRQAFRVREKISQKVVTIYNGLDIDCFTPSAGEKERRELDLLRGVLVIALIGVFDPCKGHRFLLEALRKYVSEISSEIVCLFIGDGRERDALLLAVKEMNIEGNVKFLGYRNDVSRILAAIDIVVMPSLQESFPRVALESMAMEVPVIATSVGGLPECIKNDTTGIIVEPGDSHALFEAMCFLAEHPEKRVQIGKTGRKRVSEMFTLERNCQATEKLYMDLLHES